MKAMKKLGGVVLSAALALALVVAPNMSAKADGTLRVWFDNSDGWGTVNAYYADADWANGNADWPGEEVTATQDGWYYVDIDSSMGWMIFNDGSSQTTDIDISGADTECWVTYADYTQDVEKGAVALTSAPAGAPSIAGGSDDADASDDTATVEDTTSSSTATQTADMVPVAGVVLALLGCGVIAFVAKKKMA